MINKKQLEDLVITPALNAIGLHSPAAVRLLMLTSATESNLGTYVKQHPTGPALGIYQMEKNSYEDLWDSVLNFHPTKKKLILDRCSYNYEPAADCLIWDMRLATCMARIQYWRYPEKLPDAEDDEALIDYYMKYWGPNPLHTSADEALRRARFCLGETK